MIPVFALLACDAPEPAAAPVDTGGTTALPVADSLQPGDVPDDFALVDLNPASPDFERVISVHDQRGAVTAWYFFQAACSYCSQQVQDLQRMQDELDAEHGELGIRLHGVNRIGLEEYAASLTGVDLPILQDTLSDGAWDAWMSSNRDIFVLDADGILSAHRMLSPPDEGNQGIVGSPENYADLKAMILEAAQ